MHFQAIDNASKTVFGQSGKRHCYSELLQFSGPNNPVNRCKSVTFDVGKCYSKLLQSGTKSVLRRGRIFYYRHNVPSDAQPLLKRQQIWRSLRTDSPSLAMRRLPSIVADIESMIELARWEAGLPVDMTLLPQCRSEPAAPSTPQTVLGSVRPDTDIAMAPHGLTISEAYRLYIDDPTRSWSNSTREAYETCRRLTVSIIGGDIPLSTLSRVHCRDLLDVLQSLPSNAAKRYPNLSPRVAAEVAKSRGDMRLISAANVNTLMANFGSFLNWAVNEELLLRNPARGLRLPDPISKRDKRSPFSKDQLRRIFNAPLYRGCLDGGRGYKTVGECRPRNARFWIPLVALFTGARLGEICQLDTTDIRTIDDVDCIVISERSLNGSVDKSLKTHNSDRIIPIHRKLADCGLLEFAQAQKVRGHRKLFGDVNTGTDGVEAVAFSKWFTQFLRSCGGQQPRTSFHSFRHNFRDELRAAHIDHNVGLLLGGWSTGSSRNAVHANYGSGYRVGALNAAMQQLTFRDVDISHLVLGSTSRHRK